MTTGGDELLIRAALRDELTGPLAAIRAEIAHTGAQAAKAGGQANIGARGFDKMASGASRLAKMAGKASLYVGGGMVAALTGVAVWGGKAAVGIETATMNLTTLTGSAATATKMVKQLNKYGNATTFDTAGLTQAAQQLLTYGITAKDVMPDIKMLGDISMGNQEKLSGLAYVFAQIQGNGHLMGQDLNQMINNGFNPLSDMAKRTGRSMGELRKEMAAGNISFQDVQKSLEDATKKGGQFYKGASNGSKTVAGAWGNLTGTISSQLGMAFQPVLPVVRKAFGKVSDYASSKNADLKRLVKGAVVDIQDLALAGSMGPDQFANVLGSKLGVNLVDPLHKVEGIAKDVGTILTGSVVPAFKDLTTGTLAIASPLGHVDDLLHFMAGHTTTTKLAIEGLVVGLTVAKVASLGFAAAEKVSLLWLKLHTVGTKENAIVTKGAAAAQAIWTGAVWLFNAALEANPIGLVVVAIAALVAGIIIAYKHSETFRKIVGEAFHYVGLAVGWLLDRMADFLGALGHIPGFGWAKDAANAIHDAADKTRSFADSLRQTGDSAHAATGPTKLLADTLDRLHDKTVTIRTVQQAGNLSKIAGMYAGTGDTASSHAHGRGNLASTYAAHHAAMAATGARLTVTNALIGGGGRGRGSGDHQAGRALDVQGKGLGRYGAHMRALGGYAAFHGTGSGRHLHVVPPAMGDTRSSVASRVRPRPLTATTSTATAPVVIAPGAIVVQNPASDIDLERSIAAGIRTYLRDQEERS